MTRHVLYRPRVLAHPARTVTITARQAQCLDSLCDGLSNAHIGERFGLTEDTVKCHVRRLVRRLGAQSRTHAVGLVLTGRVTVLVANPGIERDAA